MSRVEEAVRMQQQHIANDTRDGDKQFGHISMLCDEYLKMRDPTLITEEWAAKAQSRNVGLIATARGWNLRTILFDGDNHCRWFTDVIVSTCGQVRCLLLAAGIECDA